MSIATGAALPLGGCSDSSEPSQTVIPMKYRLRCTSHELFLNDDPIVYSEQILNMDKFYIIKVAATSQLKTPIILHRNRQIDSLDRRVFVKRFVYEIVKSLEICSLGDAVFIVERIPKQVKYMVAVVNGVSLQRWKQLLMSDTFYVAFYQSLQTLITKKQSMSPLRRDMLEDLLKTNLINCHQRLFYMLDSLVLENEDLRGVLMNLNRMVVLEQVERRRFFESHILGQGKGRKRFAYDEELSDSEDDGSQNSGKEDNLSQGDKDEAVQRLKDIVLVEPPNQMVQNAINIIKSCQRIRQFPREVIMRRVLNRRFFNLLRFYFKAFFETQREKLLELLALVSSIDLKLLWETTFEEGQSEAGLKNNRNLKLLEVMMTNQVINYAERSKSQVKKRPQALFGKKSVSLVNNSPSSSTWPYCFAILQKALTVLQPSEQRRQFINGVLDSMISCRLINEELQYILLYLESSLNARCSVEERESAGVWRGIVGKIEGVIARIREDEIERRRKRERVREIERERQRGGVSPKVRLKFQNRSNLILCEDDQAQRSNSRSKSTSSSSISKPHSGLIQRSCPPAMVYLPVGKTALITLMKIYKLLVRNERRFGLGLDLQCLDYLLAVTKYRKGVIEGVRLALIGVIETQVNGERESRLDDSGVGVVSE